MSDIKRYDLHYNYENGVSCVAPKADGVYVLYTDHLKTQERLQETERQLESTWKELVETEVLLRQAWDKILGGEWSGI